MWNRTLYSFLTTLKHVITASGPERLKGTGIAVCWTYAELCRLVCGLLLVCVCAVVVPIREKTEVIMRGLHCSHSQCFPWCFLKLWLFFVFLAHCGKLQSLPSRPNPLRNRHSVHDSRATCCWVLWRTARKKICIGCFPQTLHHAQPNACANRHECVIMNSVSAKINIMVGGNWYLCSVLGNVSWSSISLQARSYRIKEKNDCVSLGKNGLSFVSFFFVAEIFILMSHMLLLEKEQVKFTGCLSVYENMEKREYFKFIFVVPKKE